MPNRYGYLWQKLRDVVEGMMISKDTLQQRFCDAGHYLNFSITKKDVINGLPGEVQQELHSIDLKTREIESSSQGPMTPINDKEEEAKEAIKRIFEFYTNVCKEHEKEKSL